MNYKKKINGLEKKGCGKDINDFYVGHICCGFKINKHTYLCPECSKLKQQEKE